MVTQQTNWSVRSIAMIEHKGKKAGFSSEPQSHPGTSELFYVDYGRMILYVQYESKAKKADTGVNKEGKLRMQKCTLKPAANKLSRQSQLSQDRRPTTKRFKLGPGDCFLTSAGAIHYIKGEKAKPFSFLNIAFRGIENGSIFGRVLHLLPNERSVLQLLKAESENRPAYYQQMQVLKLTEFLLFLQRRNDSAIRPQPLTGENRLRYRKLMVRRALTCLAESISQPLNITAVSRAAGVSASHLRLLVRKETGLSLRQHLRQMRIEFAKRLLMESPANVDEVCYRVGYESVPHFCSVFKKLVKMTPSQYARSLGCPSESIVN